MIQGSQFYEPFVQEFKKELKIHIDWWHHNQERKRGLAPMWGYFKVPQDHIPMKPSNISAINKYNKYLFKK